MNFKRDFTCLVLGSWISLVIVSSNAAAEGGEAENRDWPCEQILVYEVSAAVVWDGPAVEGLDGAWQKVDRVNTLVQRITSAGYAQDAADKEIAQFASEQESQQKDQMLTLLFAGVLEVLNSERSMMLSGIIRYSRGQTKLAHRLGEDLDEMVRLEENLSEDAGIKLEALRKQLMIKQRIFDEREEFIQHLCSRPVVVEQRLGFLARSIAYYLD